MVMKAAASQQAPLHLSEWHWNLPPAKLIRGCALKSHKIINKPLMQELL